MDDKSTRFLESANSYRLHQDLLRWSLLGGYAAFLVAVLALDTRPDGLVAIGLVAIGVCYMIILGVENFFYNLFAEYVKHCETRIASEQIPQTMKEFTRENAKRVNPYHHSFFFAMFIVFLGNAVIASSVTSGTMRWNLYAVNCGFFLSVLLGWRLFFYHYVVEPFQRIFDVDDVDKNWLWKLISKRRKTGDGEGK